MIILYAVAFLSGLLTILAPCIWPLLPIVLADVTQSHSRRRPLGITVGVAVSFSVLTLSVSILESSLGLNPNVLRKLAVLVLVILGVSMVIPKASQWLETRISYLSGRFGSFGQNTRSDFKAGFTTGLALGIVWAPCSGPILASIATLAATNKVSLQVVVVTLFYVVGVSIPLFFFAVGGQRLLIKSRALSRFTGKIQIASGVVMILTAVAIYTNYDKTLESRLLNFFPSYSNTLTKIESTKSVSKALLNLKGRKSGTLSTPTTAGLFNTDSPAPNFQGGTRWLNSPAPLTITSLKGNVVLVDFWTYTCINCIRTLPHIAAWYERYSKYGLKIIGIHSPEFPFEQDQNNVLQAIKRFNIKYPIVQDNNLNIWNAYNNEYWPAEYLIDARGHIRRTDFGEGQYSEMESAIRALLAESGHQVSIPMTNVGNTTPTTPITPETYFGSDRDQYAFPQPIGVNGVFTFKNPVNLPQNQFGLGGKWEISAQYIRSTAGSTLSENFGANHVYIILKPHTSGAVDRVDVTLNGKPLVDGLAGKDVHRGLVTVDSDRLYDIYDSQSYGSGVLKFTFHDSGTEAYTFTFG
jgi:cytochrome c biogenesis protein CcdA/thiol-disulfide isomerase/thioredoxin